MADISQLGLSESVGVSRDCGRQIDANLSQLVEIKAAGVDLIYTDTLCNIIKIHDITFFRRYFVLV